METIVWRLRDNGRLLEIYKVNASRQMKLILPLKLTKPFTEADATKFINDNYPLDKTAVQQAAETIANRKP